MDAKSRKKRKAYQRKWQLDNPEKVKAYSAKWEKNNRGRRRAIRLRLIGEPGSAKREAYNEKRRILYKQGFLAELEAQRKHKASLHEFIRSKVA